MTHDLRCKAIAIAVLTAFACSSNDSDDAASGARGAADAGERDGGQSRLDGGGGSSGKAGDAGREGAAGRDGGVATGTADGGGAGYGGGCPQELSDGACDSDGRVCSYGDDRMRPECRDQIKCEDGAWVAMPSRCAEPESSDRCPRGVPNGVVGCQGTGRCVFESGAECQCVGVWVCDLERTPQAGGCPTQIPNAGSTCQGALRCSYPCRPLTETLVTAICDDEGAWTWELASCSMSGG